MFYVIQTNTNLSDDNLPIDFQSIVYKVSGETTWKEFKEYILSNKELVDRWVYGTLAGTLKPNNYKIEKILINDDFHLEIMVTCGKYNRRCDSKFYMVEEVHFNAINKYENNIKGEMLDE